MKSTRGAFNKTPIWPSFFLFTKPTRRSKQAKSVQKIFYHRENVGKDCGIDLPLICKFTCMTLGGWVEIWHSYVPSSIFWVGEIFRRQLLGYWNSTVYRGSPLYVWCPTVSSSIPSSPTSNRRLTHDTCESSHYRQTRRTRGIRYTARTVLSWRRLILQFRYTLLPICTVMLVTLPTVFMSSKWGPYLHERMNIQIELVIFSSLIDVRLNAECTTLTYPIKKDKKELWSR